MFGRSLGLQRAAGRRCFSSLVGTAAESDKTPLRNPSFRTSVTDQADLSISSYAQWYSVPPAEVDKVLPGMTLPPIYKRQFDTFGESCFVVRKPFLLVKNAMQNHTEKRPAVRFLLYGKTGNGKSVSLCQLQLFAHHQDFVIVHCITPQIWTKNFKEVAPSTWKAGRIDLPLEAVTWLKNFKDINGHLLEKYDLKTSKRYEWTKREVVEADQSLLGVVEYGINRAKYASDCIGVVLKELQHHARQHHVKLFVSVDHMNGLWGTTKIRREDFSYADASDLSLVRHFKKIIRGDFNNGVVVCAVDVKAHRGKEPPVYPTPHILPQPSYLPTFLLGKEGFELLDPFIPVKVEKYSDREIHSVIDYYIDRNWIQNPLGKTDEGREQLIHLSARNPFLLERMCASW